MRYYYNQLYGPFDRFSWNSEENNQEVALIFKESSHDFAKIANDEPIELSTFSSPIL